ncbi:MAG: hypothetical protein JXD23_00640 [Spirochaetales bacterium]|nr:hypothetical protein [Spirochaetales bacterium]
MKRFAIFAAALLFIGLAARADDNIEDLLYSKLGQQRNTQAGLNELIKQATAELAAKPNGYGLLWMYAALNYYQGEFYSTKPEDKKKYFTLCKDYADKAVKVDPKGIAGHYWLGVGLAKWAEANGVLYSLFSADDILEQMTIVINMDPAYFKGLPFAIRASVYALAPGIISVGDWTKARADIASAFKYGKDYRSNYLIIADIYISWGEWRNAEMTISEGLAIPYDKRLPLEEDDCIAKLRLRLAKVDVELARSQKK